MVISRNDIKRRRKDSDTTVDTLPESPKRTKVHAQRKFAQGSNVSSPVITPVKEIEKDKPKCTEIITPPAELLPISRPNTEDFLTFLCFRGTSILPPNLDYFNTANASKPITEHSSRESKNDKNKGSKEDKNDRPFIAFGVRKRADPFVSSKLEKKRRHALALQTLRRKYQEQRLAKIRAVTIEKMNEGVKIKSKDLVRTRSVAKREADARKGKKIKIVTKHVKITTTTRTTVRKPIIKQRMCLRSKGRFVARELSAPVRGKIRRPIIKRKISLKKEPEPKNTVESSSEFSSDDNQPLVQAVKKSAKFVSVKPNPLKFVKNPTLVPNKKETSKEMRETKEKRDSKETKIMKITKDAKETKVTIDTKDMKETKMSKDKKETKSTKVTKVVKCAKDIEVLKVTKDSKVIKDIKESKITKDTKESKVTKDVKEPKDIKESKDTKESKDPKILKVTKDIIELKIPKDTKESKDIKITKDSQDIKVTKESKDTKDLKVKSKDEKLKYLKSKTRVTRTSSKTVETEEKVETTTNGPSQRPSRKTKEAAALYMNLLGPKLVMDPTVDDDSIDSFPELPNVRRTERQEIEMKAKVITNSSSNRTTRESIRKSIEVIKKVETKLDDNTKVEIKQKLLKPMKEKESLDSSDEELIKKDVEEKKDFRPKKRPVPVLKAEAKLKVVEMNEQSFSDSDEEPLANLTIKKKILTMKKPNEKKPETETKTDRVLKKSTAIEENTETKESMTKTDKSSKNEIKFGPLSDDDDEKVFRGFVKTEEINILSQTILQKSICLHTEMKIVSSVPQSADLLCKDVGRRFGKGKVNMSTEQIEKWLDDNALAGQCSKKEEKKTYDEEIIKFEEKEPKEYIKSSTIDKYENKKLTIVKPEKQKDDDIVIKSEKLEKKESSEIKTSSPEINSNKLDKPTERKTIFKNSRCSILNKDRKDSEPNSQAFSPNNESSVYAFEADNDMPINTPFRSQIRRPSSTATSRSEDDSSKTEDEEKKKQFNKFRLPTVVKPTTTKTSSQNQANKQEVSLTLSADEVNNSASIAVQVNLDSATFTDNNVSMECSTQTDTGDEDGEGHLFYIPLQSGKQLLNQSGSSSQSIIQGVTVKLGTEGISGPNQRVVMRAKLVTTPDNRLPILGQQKPLAQSTHMCPPIGTVQPTYRSKQVDVQRTKSVADSAKIDTSTLEVKPNVPSSPSASSSSSAKLYKKPCKARARLLDACAPSNSSQFPTVGAQTQLVEALTFHPTEKEFQDPIDFIEKIRPIAEKFGICRIVPPATFKPECKVTDDMRFTAYNQYVHKMLHRWGPNFKEFMAIKKYLATQSVTFTHPPWVGGMEIDLPRLYQTVQLLGGLKEVIEKKRWSKVAEGMKIPKSAQDRVTKLDDIYCKYLLPYDTLSPTEREKLFDEVETDWAKHESRILLRSQQNQDNVSVNDEDSEESDEEAEECITKGRNMALNAFYRIARNTMSMWFKTPEPFAQEVEQEFWKHVSQRQNHLCVHSGSIDSSGWGYGFACNKNSPFARHPWNLKILTNNSGSVLRSMGPIMGVTVPTLHVGMVFSACCWYRDPHGLPWIEYLHTGGNKIWYGIPDSHSNQFRAALTKLVPNYIRNKTLWLPSDTAMVPPNLLTQNGVSLCRTVQEPGQFIVVFPKAFTSSICSGYCVSESVYFAPPNWLLTAKQVFNDIKDSCEPSMFSLERLFLNIASDNRANPEVLKQISADIQDIIQHEKTLRTKLESMGLTLIERLHLPDINNTKKRRKLQEDDGEYECEICRTNLYISLVTNSHEEGVYCLDHAVEHLVKKPTQLKYLKLMYSYDLRELDGLIDKIKANIEAKSHRKIPSKFAGMATLLK